eukprot:6180799-Pleurochrysis_carterae.AAC.3
MRIRAVECGKNCVLPWQWPPPRRPTAAAAAAAAPERSGDVGASSPSLSRDDGGWSKISARFILCCIFCFGDLHISIELVSHRMSSAHYE